MLTGYDEDDTLSSAGDDLPVGGQDNDRLVGGLGSEVFGFKAGDLRLPHEVAGSSTRSPYQARPGSQSAP